jgi:hypothetical protein
MDFMVTKTKKLIERRLEGFLYLQLFTILFACNKFKSEPSEPPTVTTKEVTDITSTTATAGGNIIKETNSNVYVVGVNWGKTIQCSEGDANRYADYKDFTQNITRLTPNTEYYVKAYANSNAGIGYGNVVTFRTLTAPPSLTTLLVSSITNTTAVSGGSITAENGGAVISRGVCWATNPDPTITDNKSVDGSGTGNFSSLITGLKSGTIYYLRAYATNSIGTGYGNQVSFATLGFTGGFSETFTTGTTNPQDWKSDGAAIWVITNGVYRAYSGTLYSLAYYNKPFNGNFTYQFDVTYNGSTTGMAVMISDDFKSGYTFLIHGSWSFFKRVNNYSELLVGPITSSYINQPEKTNALKISYSSATSTFTMYANNNFLGTVVDSTFKSGRFGMIYYTPNNMSNKYYSEYDNVNLTVTSAKSRPLK